MVSNESNISKFRVTQQCGWRDKNALSAVPLGGLGVVSAVGAIVNAVLFLIYGGWPSNSLYPRHLCDPRLVDEMQSPLKNGFMARRPIARGQRSIGCSMSIDKFTQKMQEAVQASQDVASEFNQQEITNEHFLPALLDQAEAITRPLLEKLGVPAESLKERLRDTLQKLPV